jgi:tetratricopeptide (TPR) repeat protein
MDTYLAEGDTNNYLQTVQEARKVFPSNNDLASKEINVYIAQKKVDEAIENINAAIKNDPDNYVLYANLGILYQNNKENAKAEATYLQAIQINASGFDALYNLGALYYNQGAEKNNEANGLPRNQNAKYQELTKNANELFLKAQPYIEKAYQDNETALEKNANDPELLRNKRDALTSLKLLYNVLGDDTKYQEMSDKLKNL